MNRGKSVLAAIAAVLLTIGAFLLAGCAMREPPASWSTDKASSNRGSSICASASQHYELQTYRCPE